jgi:hypothetical protein
MRRVSRLLVGGVLVMWLVWWAYVPDRIDPSPITDPNPGRERIETCGLLPIDAVEGLLGDRGTLRATREDVPPYQSGLDRAVAAMHISLCTYSADGDEGCVTDTRATRAKEVSLGVTAMRNRSRAMERWQVLQNTVRRAEPVGWREDQIGERPAYSFVSDEGAGVYRVWDQRFLLSLQVLPCRPPKDAEATQSLIRDTRVLAENLQLPAERFVWHPGRR